MNEATLATFNELAPAQHLQQRLQAEGFKAQVQDESKQERFWYLSEPLAAIHVEVPADQYEAALSKIRAWEETDEHLRKAVRCPSCHGSKIEYPQLTRKALLPAVGALLMKLKIIPRQFYCHSCHYTWGPGKEPVDPPRDALGWPSKSKLWHPEKRP